MEMELNMDHIKRSPCIRKDCLNKQFIKLLLTTSLPKQELETDQSITEYAYNIK